MWVQKLVCYGDGGGIIDGFCVYVAVVVFAVLIDKDDHFSSYSKVKVLGLLSRGYLYFS